VLPFWLETVTRHLGAPGAPQILKVMQDGNLLGIAPFAVDTQGVHFLGSADVCDYQDIVTAPGQEALVVQALFDYLAAQKRCRLELGTLRPDSALFKGLEQVTANHPLKIERALEDVTFETPLPHDWEAYLLELNGKQRHEIRRKLRRLETHSAFAFRTADNNGALAGETERFLQLFRMNRADKAQFMNPAMSAYFRDLIAALAEHRLLRLFFLEVEQKSAATVLCFDYDGVRYLYNSGYDAQFHDLSVGLISKLLSIQSGIDAGCRRFDFLKGDEVYKKRIGGQQIPLYKCTIEL
jgi:CelD/BcsL family acetyltransferase involved in cellulose biosynthesis